MLTEAEIPFQCREMRSYFCVGEIRKSLSALFQVETFSHVTTNKTLLQISTKSTKTTKAIMNILLEGYCNNIWNLYFYSKMCREREREKNTSVGLFMQFKMFRFGCRSESTIT